MKLPGQAVFTSQPPETYKSQHMFVGATLCINNFYFVLINADEYALRFMELHAHEVSIISSSLTSLYLYKNNGLVVSQIGHQADHGQSSNRVEADIQRFRR